MGELQRKQEEKQKKEASSKAFNGLVKNVKLEKKARYDSQRYQTNKKSENLYK